MGDSSPPCGGLSLEPRSGLAMTRAFHRGSEDSRVRVSPKATQPKDDNVVALEDVVD